MIDAQNLSKAYGDVQALDDVSFEVKAGEIVGLLGPNGAGKTTAIKILTGFLQPDEGTVTIDGSGCADAHAGSSGADRLSCRRMRRSIPNCPCKSIS